MGAYTRAARTQISRTIREQCPFNPTSSLSLIFCSLFFLCFFRLRFLWFVHTPPLTIFSLNSRIVCGTLTKTHQLVMDDFFCVLRRSKRTPPCLSCPLLQRRGPGAHDIRKDSAKTLTYTLGPTNFEVIQRTSVSPCESPGTFILTLSFPPCASAESIVAQE